MQIYEPDEDSYLLEGFVKKLAFGRVLDMGTGTGIQAKAVRNAEEIIAADINQDCRKNFEKTAIKFVKSDLFENLKNQTFDVIIFNPPYLPEDKGIEDPTIYGGKKGYELIEKFLDQAKDHLSKKGFILLLFSSLTRKKEVDRIIEDNCFEKKTTYRKKNWLFLKNFMFTKYQNQNC